jgi:hypothetical protein
VTNWVTIGTYTARLPRTRTDAKRPLTSMFVLIKVRAICIRDEEVAGSNPVTPTQVRPCP